MSLQSESRGAPSVDDHDIDLIRPFPPRPIKSAAEHDRAIEAIDALADRRESWGPDEQDYFLVLALLIERYESEIYGEPGPELEPEAEVSP